MGDALRTAITVSTPLALLSVALIVYYFLSVRYWKNRETMLANLPPEDRARFADEEITRYGVQVGDAKPKERVEILKTELERKHRTGLHRLYIFAFVGLVCFAIAAYCYVQSLSTVSSPKLSKAPDPIPFVTAESYRSDKLPDGIFGSKTDEAGRHRQWMDTHERGAASRLGDPNARFFWLLSKPFGGPTLPYQAHVYVNTKAPVEIAAWVVGPTKQDVLSQTSGNGPDVVYHFGVPQTAADERLLIFIAIRRDDYEAIDAVNKFVILSELRSDATE